MRMASSLKTKLLALLGALVLIVLIGVNTDLVDQVRDREKDGKPVYTKHRITLNSGELTKQGSIKSDLLPVFSQEESESELEEVIQALSGSDQQERELEVRLISQDLIDDRKLNELLEFAGEVRYTGFEYQGKKFFQRSGEQQSEVEQNLEPQLAGIRELLDTSTVIAVITSAISAI